MAIPAHNEQEITEFINFFKLSAALTEEEKPIPVYMLSDCLNNDNTEKAKAKRTRAIKKILLKLHPDKADLQFIPLYSAVDKPRDELIALQKKIHEKFTAAVHDRKAEALLFMEAVNHRLTNPENQYENKSIQETVFLQMPSALGLKRKYKLSTELQNEAWNTFANELSYLLQEGIALPQRIEDILYHTAVNKGAEVGAFALTLLERKLTDFVIGKGTRFVISKLLKGMLGCVTDAVAMYEQLKNITEILNRCGKTIQEFLSASPDNILKELKSYYPLLTEINSDKRIKKGIKGLQLYYNTQINQAYKKASNFVADSLKVRSVIRPITLLCLKTAGSEIGAITGTVFAEKYIKNQVAKPVHAMLNSILGIYNSDLKCLPIETQKAKLAKIIIQGTRTATKLFLDEEASESMLKTLNVQIEHCLKQAGIPQPQTFFFNRVMNVGSCIAHYMPITLNFRKTEANPKQKVLAFWRDPSVMIENKNLDEQRTLLSDIQSCINDGSLVGDNIFSFLELKNSLILEKNFKSRRNIHNILKIMDKNITPLMVAVVSANLGVVKSLLSCSEINSNVGGITALHLALLFRHNEIAKTLLAMPDCAYTMPGGFDRATPLAIACFNANVEMVQLILEKDPNMDMNIPLAYGKTLLHCACKSISQNNLTQSFLIINALLTRGALLGATDSDAITPLQDCPPIPGIIDVIKNNIGDVLIEHLKNEFKILAENPMEISNEFRALFHICQQLRLNAALLENQEYQQILHTALAQAIANQHFAYANHLLLCGIPCPIFSIEDLKQILPAMIEYAEGESHLLTSLLNQYKGTNNPEMLNEIKSLFFKKLSTTLRTATWLNFLPGAIDYGKIAERILTQYHNFLEVEDFNALLEIALNRGYGHVARFCIPKAKNLSNMLVLMDNELLPSLWTANNDYLETRKALVNHLPISNPLLIENKTVYEKQCQDYLLKSLIENLGKTEQEKLEHEERVLAFIKLPQGFHTLNMQTADGKSLFLAAIDNNRYDFIIKLLEAGVDLNIHDNYAKSSQLLNQRLKFPGDDKFYSTLEHRLRAFVLSKAEIKSPTVIAEQKKIEEYMGILANIEPLFEKTAEEFKDMMCLILNKPNAKDCLQKPIFSGNTLFNHLIKYGKYEHAEALLSLSEQLPIDKRLDVNAEDMDAKTPVLLCFENLSSYSWGTPSEIEKSLALRLLDSVDLSISNQKQRLETLLNVEREKGFLSRNSDVKVVFDKLDQVLKGSVTNEVEPNPKPLRMHCT